MAQLRLFRDHLEVHLSLAESLLALRRAPVIVARDTVRSAIVTEDPWIWLQGLRAPGFVIPRVVAVGSMWSRGGQDFVVMKGTRPALILELRPGTAQPYSRIILTNPKAAEVVRLLKPQPPEPSQPAAGAKGTGELAGQKQKGKAKPAEQKTADAGQGGDSPSVSGEPISSDTGRERPGAIRDQSDQHKQAAEFENL